MMIPTMMVARRMLLGAGHAHHGHAHGAEEQDHEEEAHAEPEYTLDLRIASIFVIWIGALAFGVPTLLIKAFRDPEAVFPRLLRAFAGGLILSLALVHIITEAVFELEGLVSFHIAGVTVLFGIVVLVILDSSLSAHLAPAGYKAQIRQDVAARRQAKAEAAAKAAAEPPVKHGRHGSSGSAASARGADQLAAAAAADFAAADSHNHQCMRSLSATAWAASASGAADENAAGKLLSVKQFVTAYTMELGCLVHSLVIGIGLGVITNSRSLVVTLMVALTVHQGLEALALGSVLAMATFRPLKKFVLMMLYTLAAPAGIAIGIAIAASYDPSSVTARAVQGTLNGVSGGMLLYIGMYQLVAEEFSRSDLLARNRLRLGMYAALILGCAAMAVLGIWA